MAVVRRDGLATHRIVSYRNRLRKPPSLVYNAHMPSVAAYNLPGWNSYLFPAWFIDKHGAVTIEHGLERDVYTVSCRDYWHTYPREWFEVEYNPVGRLVQDFMDATESSCNRKAVTDVDSIVSCIGFGGGGSGGELRSLGLQAQGQQSASNGLYAGIVGSAPNMQSWNALQNIPAPGSQLWAQQSAAVAAKQAQLQMLEQKIALDKASEVCDTPATSDATQGGKIKFELKQPGEIKVDKDVLPDISLTRALKWAVVALIALALGERVWRQFGGQLVKNLEKTITGASKDA